MDTLAIVLSVLAAWTLGSIIHVAIMANLIDDAACMLEGDNLVRPLWLRLFWMYDFCISLPIMTIYLLCDILTALYMVVYRTLSFIVDLMELPNFFTTARYGGLFLNTRSMKKVRKCLPDDHPLKKKVP